MSHIVWSADKGWHDGPEAKVTLENGRIKAYVVVIDDKTGKLIKKEQS